VYQETAHAIATRVKQEVGAGPTDAAALDARIARAFTLVVSRDPTPTETRRLHQLYDESLAAANDSTAALTDVASAILNLDSAFVR
jgi:hypothetical protein